MGGGLEADVISIGAGTAGLHEIDLRLRGVEGRVEARRRYFPER